MHARPNPISFTSLKDADRLLAKVSEQKNNLDVPTSWQLAIAIDKNTYLLDDEILKLTDEEVLAADINLQDNLDELTWQLVIATDGNTYLLGDIQELTDEEVFASDLYFVTADGAPRSIIDVRKALENQNADLLDELIHNEPLAEMLITKLPPQPSYLSFLLDLFPVVFPVTSYLENTWEEHVIEDYLLHCRNNRIEETAPIVTYQSVTRKNRSEDREEIKEKEIEENEKKPTFTPVTLTRKHLLPNIALQQLIQTRILFLENVRREILNEVEHRINPGRKLTAKLDRINRILEEYEKSLLEKHIYFRGRKESFEKWQAECQQYINKMPELENKSIEELNIINAKHNARKRKWTLIANIARRAWQNPYLLPAIHGMMILSNFMMLFGFGGAMSDLFLVKMNLNFFLTVMVVSAGAGVLSMFMAASGLSMLQTLEIFSLNLTDQIKKIEDMIHSLIILSEEKDFIENFMEGYESKMQAIDNQLQIISVPNSTDTILNILQGSSNEMESVDEEIRFDDEASYNVVNDGGNEYDEERGSSPEEQSLLPLQTSSIHSSWTAQLGYLREWAGLFARRPHHDNDDVELALYNDMVRQGRF